MAGRIGCFRWMIALWLVAQSGSAFAQAAAPPPPAVTVAPVVSREVTQTADFIGRITAINKVDIVARVAGFIEQRLFTEGQMVKTGDLLFSIEPATANLAKAKAAEINAALQLTRAQQLVRNQNIPQATVDQRVADEASAQADIMEA